MPARIPATSIKLDVLTERVSNLKDDVREVRNLVSDKIATKEYVDDRLNPLKKLVYWELGLLGTILVGILIALIGVLVRK
jgi:hypothetical protein